MSTSSLLSSPFFAFLRLSSLSLSHVDREFQFLILGLPGHGKTSFLHAVCGKPEKPVGRFTKQQWVAYLSFPCYCDNAHPLDEAHDPFAASENRRAGARDNHFVGSAISLWHCCRSSGKVVASPFACQQLSVVPLTASYYPNRDGVFLLYDVTDVQSRRLSLAYFEVLSLSFPSNPSLPLCTSLPPMYQEMSRYCPDDVMILVLGTKIDSEKKRMVRWRPKHLEVSSFCHHAD